MRVLVTGPTGFVGARLVGRLLDRGDVVVGLARSPASAQQLIDRGCRFVQGTITQEPAVRAAVQRCDAVFHLAGASELGVPRSGRSAMEAANVAGADLLLRAAADEGVPRIVVVSSVIALGDTHGAVVDESHDRRDEPYRSLLEETRARAHQASVRRSREGLPVTIVLLGQVYGPGDPSFVGDQIARAASGTLRRHRFPDVGFEFVHVDDAVEGIVRSLDRAGPGRAYVLGGERATLRTACELAATLGGHSRPGEPLPRAVLRLVAACVPGFAQRAGLPPNLAELARATSRVTYWASDEVARRELGYAPRGLEAGLRDLLG